MKHFDDATKELTKIHLELSFIQPYDVEKNINDTFFNRTSVKYISYQVSQVGFSRLTEDRSYLLSFSNDMKNT